MKKRLAAIVAAALALAALPAFAARQDGATIVNSGSTNSAGYIVKVWSDGRASYVYTHHGVPLGQSTSGQVSAQTAGNFIGNLRDAKHSGQIVSRACAKSASIGTSLVVKYHGWTTPDLSCPGDGFVVSLAADANAITGALNLKSAPFRRTPMLPNEKRRIPVENPATQASASPEPAASSS